MRTRVTRSFRFEAAHQLPWHPGVCRNLHGHSYRLEVTVAGPLDERGVVVDFDELAALVQTEVIDQFDHRFLNDVLDNPTAELIAADIWRRLDAAGLDLARIALWETPDSVAELLAE